MQAAQTARLQRPAAAFTLIELLVVLGIIAVLMSLLLPALASVRRQGQLVRCMSNLRQLATAFHEYAAENKNRFPPDLGGTREHWFDDRYLGNILARDGITKGGIFSCPRDEDSKLSYSMNAWACSALDNAILQANPRVGVMWGPAGRHSSSAMLLIESWSFRDFVTGGYSALPIVGYRGDHPGRRFGGGGGLKPFDVQRFGYANSEVDYSRHRPRNSWATSTQPGGIVNIAYMDGHVASKHEWELVNSDGSSTLNSLWSIMDIEMNRPLN